MNAALSPAIELLNRWADVWWRQIFHGAWQAALVAGGLIVIVWLGRRWPSPLRYALMLVALAKFLFPPLVALPTGVFSHAPVRITAPAATSPPMGKLPAAPRAALSRNQAGVFEHGDTAPAMQPSRRVAVALSWRAWLMLVHLGGCVLLLGLVARQLAALHNLVQGSTLCDQPGPVRWLQSRSRQWHMRRSVALRVSHTVDSPLSFGVLRPTIILPAHALWLSRPDLETILAHELAHLPRGDAWIAWLQVLACAAWWFHPMAWLTARWLRQIREDCCDDLILASGVTTRSAYCDTLLRTAERFSHAPPVSLACGMAQHFHPLAHRLRRILDPDASRVSRLPVPAALALLLVAAVLLPGLARETSPPRGAPEPVALHAGNEPDRMLQPASNIATSDQSPAVDLASDPRFGHSQPTTESELKPGAVASSSSRVPAIRLDGDWLLTLPAGFEYRVRWEPRGDGAVFLDHPALSFRGLYRWHDGKLVLDEPDDARMAGLTWVADSPDVLRLVSPAVAANGGRYVGALLTPPGHKALGAPAAAEMTQPPADLSGAWRMSLPAGHIHEVRLRPAALGGYWLEPNHLNASGQYQVRGTRLVLLVPGDPRMAGFAWEIEPSGQIRLVEQPPLSTTGANYLGATLARSAAP